MKIVGKDNFDRDSVSDELVVENVGKFYGEHIVKFLNEKFGGETAPRYYELKEDWYELYDAWKGVCDE